LASLLRRTAIIKPAIFALLAINAGLYATSERFSEGLDACAWFALLALFEMETRCPQWTRIPRHVLALDLLRLIAAAGIAIAAFSFIREQEWLDAGNAWLWIGVVAVLELQLRAPLLVARYRGAFTSASLTLYGALAAVALIWLIRGEWLDGYDALLWIAAFALIEMDLLRLANQRAKRIFN
jgi:hypothetical protein